ncbi:transglycosylase SLT domain-containing protein [Rickettsiella grylli]|uniref:Membrane-bound lytic murein transglycosylase D (Murein hydrolase D) (Regulatory protein DniR) n=1 Tax=Rickettsiella grylli TaxID=59196 RepID=A8PNV9_9COXI|nr:transglycosylase SLT domain-containing protein [Rickettsiella grylli]EDP46814.1 membrane-bound lytic murein transglycosylase D (Murein hydrolase D) (Regulatory protein DniR) [Rickettsiella grylli]
MTNKTIKIYTLLLSVLIVLAVGITACVQFPDSKAAGMGHENGTDEGAHKAQQTLFSKSIENSSHLAPRNAQALYGALDKGTLWAPIRAHLQLSAREENQPQVQKQIRWLAKNPVYLKEAINQAAPYIYYVYSQVRLRNLPTELVLLPIIESGYNPNATNTSSGAAGLWQLMTSTARGYGVHQDRGFDGRRDIYSSTNAALNYLTYLKSFFGGDWLLAIAAYDTGEGNVQNAIRHNAERDKNTHFWALPLASETRSYIPRLLALAAIVKNPAKYGVSLPPVSAKPYLAQVDVNSMSLTHVAKLAGMSVAALKELNPGVKNASASIKHLALPIDRVALYKMELAAASKGSSKNSSIQLVSNQPQSDVATLGDKKKDRSDSQKIYLVKTGDTLSDIAKQYHVSVKKIQVWNKLDSDFLKPGEKLKIMRS